MSLHELATSRPRLARKGEAAPVGRDSPRGRTVEPTLVMVGAAKDQPPKDRPADAAPAPQDLFPEDAAAAAEPAPAPAASLLSFDLLVRRKEPEAPAEPDAGEPQGASAPAAGDAAPTADGPSAHAPAPRVGAGPAASPRRRNRWAVPAGLAAAIAAIIAIGWLSYRAGPEPARQEAARPAPAASAQGAPAAADQGPAGDGAGAAAPKPAAPADTAPADAAPPDAAPADAMATVPQPSDPAPATDAAPGPAGPDPEARAAAVPAVAREVAPELATDGADSGPAGQSPAPVVPSVDVVRVDPDGAAVIAGRAEPHGELIVLDNGRPIGTVKADAFGEWVLIPEAPLPAGEHQFGLVVKRVQGNVSLPAAAGDESATEADAPAVEEPAAERPDPNIEGRLFPVPGRKPLSDDMPIPARKPSSAALQPGPGDDADAPAPSADFVVQLASVKTRAGAEREWLKLKRRFPELLSEMKLTLAETKLGDHGTVVRVRTGPFPAHAEARNVCARLLAERQECLVVRTSVLD